MSGEWVEDYAGRSKSRCLFSWVFAWYELLGGGLEHVL